MYRERIGRSRNSFQELKSFRIGFIDYLSYHNFNNANEGFTLEKSSPIRIVLKNSVQDNHGNGSEFLLLQLTRKEKLVGKPISHSGLWFWKLKTSLSTFKIAHMHIVAGEIQGPARYSERLRTLVTSERVEISRFCLWLELRLLIPFTREKFQISAPYHLGVLDEIPSKSAKVYGDDSWIREKNSGSFFSGILSN